VRRAARTDLNQGEIVAALRRVGATVQLLHMVGSGCPDIAAGRAGVTYFIEIKRPGEKLTDAEAAWHQKWQGHVVIVHDVDEALRAIQAL
jgi:hypothetical protein